MSRRQANSARRFTSSGISPFSGLSHSKSPVSPLLPVVLVFLVQNIYALFISFYLIIFLWGYTYLVPFSCQHRTATTSLPLSSPPKKYRIQHSCYGLQLVKPYIILKFHFPITDCLSLSDNQGAIFFIGYFYRGSGMFLICWKMEYWYLLSLSFSRPTLLILGVKLFY